MRYSSDIGQWIIETVKPHQIDIDKVGTMESLPIITVCLALLIDCTLYSVIVPIIPVYLQTLNHPPDSMKSDSVIPKNDTSIVACCADDMVNNTRPTSSHEDLKFGILFGSKTITQILFTFISGPIIDRIGCPIPMMTGISILIVSSIVFAFGETYLLLILARSIHGIGSAFLTPSAFMLFADLFQDRLEDRSRAQGYAMAGIYLGIISGPLMGGVLYQFTRKEVPFLVLTLLAFIELVLMGYVFIYKYLQPICTSNGGSNVDSQMNGVPVHRFLTDPFIIVCVSSVFIANLSMSFLEPTIALWMKKTMNSSEWEIGIIWLPAYIPHLLGIFVTVSLIQRHSRSLWLVILTGNILVGLSILLITLCSYFWMISAPIMIIALGIAMIDTAVIPTMAFLADTHFSSQYGSVHTFDSIACSLCYGIGPILAGWIVETIGFRWMTVIVCLANVTFAPIVIVLKQLDTREVPAEPSKQKTSVKFGETTMTMYGAYESRTKMKDKNRK